MCVARKLNLLTEEDSINKDALLRFVEEGFKTEIDLVNAIKKKCFEEDISNIGKPEMCEVAKYKICITSRMAEDCPKWDSKGICSSAQQKVENFMKMLS
uniref:Odorant binding protein n=2 Tax=Bombyx mori TaxID=7091 RepID=A0A8R2HNZ0_BOMMO|nr:uncharacterized protein LOC101737025 [Bombyx mori]